MASFLSRAIINCCSKISVSYNVKRNFTLSTISRKSPPTLKHNIKLKHDKERPNTSEELLSHIKKIALKRKWLASQHLYDLINEFKKSGPLPDSYALFLLEGCGNLNIYDDKETRRDMVDTVWKLFTDSGTKLNTEYFSILLQVHIDNETKINVEKFLEEMREANLKSDNRLILKLFTYYCENGNVTKALEMFKKLKKDGVPLKEEMFTSLMIAHGRANNLNGVLQTVTEMQRTCIQPSARTYESLLQVYSEMNMPVEVTKILANISGFCISYNNLLDAHYQFLKHNNEEMAQVVFSYIPADMDTSIVAQQVIKLIKLEKYEHAYQVCLLGLIKNTKYKHKYFTYRLAKFAPLQVVLHYCNVMHISEVNIMAYESALHYFHESSQSQNSLKVLKEMKAKKILIKEHYLYPIICQLNLQQKPPDTSKIAEVLRYDPCTGSAIYEEFLYQALDAHTMMLVHQSLNEKLPPNKFRSIGYFMCLLKEDSVLEAAKFLCTVKLVIPPFGYYLYRVSQSYANNTNLAPLFAKIIVDGFCKYPKYSSADMLRRFLMKYRLIKNFKGHRSKNEATIELLQNLRKLNVYLSPEDGILLKVAYKPIFSTDVMECVDELINTNEKNAKESYTDSEQEGNFQNTCDGRNKMADKMSVSNDSDKSPKARDT